MANRNEESDREESAYGRSGNPQDRQQSRGQHQPWRETPGGQQHYQGSQYGGRPGYGAQGPIGEGGQPGVGGMGQQGIGGQGFGELGERAQGWDSDRGSDFHGGYGSGQGGQQGSQRYGQSGPYSQAGRYGEGFGQGSQGYGQGGQQPDWQRGMEQGQQGQYASQGYGQSSGQGGSRQDGGMSGGYGGQGGQQFGYGSGLGQRGFRGIGPKNYSRSDERIKEDVCERLTQDDDLDASEIEVKAEQGTITLEGTVDERWMKHRAEDIAESCSGVREVENRIRVESGSSRGRSGSESFGRSGSRNEGRSQTSTPGSSSGSSGSSGNPPH